MRGSREIDLPQRGYARRMELLVIVALVVFVAVVLLRSNRTKKPPDRPSSRENDPE